MTTSVPPPSTSPAAHGSPAPAPPPPPPRRSPPRPPPRLSPNANQASAALGFSKEDSTVSNGLQLANGYHGIASSSVVGEGETNGSTIVPYLSQSQSTSASPKVSSPSPLKAAADLIQSLDIAHTQVTNSAADAARECETARNNARAAQEICRRYQNRSFPKLQSTFGRGDMMISEQLWGMGYGSDDDHARNTYHRTTATTSRSSSRRSTPDRSYMRNRDDNRNDIDDENDQNLPRASWKSTSGGIATPTPGGRSVGPAPPSGGSASTARIGLQTPSSVDRVTQHHAEDMMQLQLELERTKQELKSERRMHEECKVVLSSFRTKTSMLEDENQALRSELEREQGKDSSVVPQLQQELEKARSQLLQAEEDADMAVAFATDGEKERSELAVSLQQAQQEIWQLKQQLVDAKPHNGKKHVHFADDMPQSTIPEESHDESVDDSSMGVQPMDTDTPRTTPSKSMIAAGRQILFRDSKASKSPEDTVLILERSPAKSAERRKRLNECLNLNGILNDNDDKNLPTPTRLPMSPARPGSSSSSMATSTPGGTISMDDNIKRKLDEYHTTVKVLQLSGRRLHLDGVWFKQEKSTIPVQLDAMARQYCQSAEYKIDQQDKEIDKLESLCDLMEKQLL